MDTWEWEQCVKNLYHVLTAPGKHSTEEPLNSNVNKMFQLVDISQPSSLPPPNWKHGCTNTVAMVAEVEASVLGSHFTANSWWKWALDHDGIRWHVMRCVRECTAHSGLVGHGNGQ